MRWEAVPLKSDKYRVLTDARYGFETIRGESVSREGGGKVKNTECDEVLKNAKNVISNTW